MFQISLNGIIINNVNVLLQYPNIPGNLLMTDDVFAKICGSDVNG